MQSQTLLAIEVNTEALYLTVTENSLHESITDIAK